MVTGAVTVYGALFILTLLEQNSASVSG